MSRWYVPFALSLPDVYQYTLIFVGMEGFSAIFQAAILGKVSPLFGGLPYAMRFTWDAEKKFAHTRYILCSSSSPSFFAFFLQGFQIWNLATTC